MRHTRLLVEVKKNGVWYLHRRTDLAHAELFARDAKQALYDREVQEVILSLEMPGPAGNLVRKAFFNSPARGRRADSTGKNLSYKHWRVASLAIGLSIIGLASLFGVHSL